MSHPRDREYKLTSTWTNLIPCLRQEEFSTTCSVSPSLPSQLFLGLTWRQSAASSSNLLIQQKTKKQRQGQERHLVLCVHSVALPNCLMNDKSHNLTGRSQIRKLFLYFTVEQLGFHLVDHYWLEVLFSLLLTPTLWQEDHPRVSLSSAQHRESSSDLPTLGKHPRKGKLQQQDPFLFQVEQVNPK